MSHIDVRNDAKKGEVLNIRFADDLCTGGNTIAYELRKCVFNKLEIHDNHTYLVVPTQEDAENLIHALQKAIELNWFK